MVYLCFDRYLNRSSVEVVELDPWSRYAVNSSNARDRASAQMSKKSFIRRDPRPRGRGVRHRRSGDGNRDHPQG